jgi:hypothetical protein
MTQRKRMAAILFAALLAFGFGLGSCTWFSSVSLSSSSYDVYSDQNFTLTATVSGTTSGSCTYEWFLNGSSYGTTSSSSVTAWLQAFSSGYQTVAVVATDESGNEYYSSDLSVYVRAGASLKVINDSSYYSITSLIFDGYEMLSSSIPHGYSYKLYNIDAGTYNMQATISSSTNARSAVSFSLGYRRTWYMDESSDTLSLNSSTLSSKATGTTSATGTVSADSGPGILSPDEAAKVLCVDFSKK